MNKDYLKMSLIDIRNSINLEKENWLNNTTTNCYSYALGLDIPESDICKYAYDPGTIGGSNHPLYIPFSYNNLIDNILLDLKALNIDYKFIKPTDSINNDEWKIAIYIPKIYTLNYLDDFHFARLRKDNTWYHKNGFIISNLDYYDQPIINPETCNMDPYLYMDCLKLKLKK